MRRRSPTHHLLRGVLFGTIFLFLSVSLGEVLGETDPAATGGLNTPPGYTDTVFELPDGVVIERLADDVKRCDSAITVAGENAWSKGGRGFLYLVALCYIFLGVALISDMFMGAIEVITSKEKVVVTVNDDGSTDTLTFRVWNETVANLTLMALGSSAPEILLSLIETLQTINEEPGELGPSTIVGSAAFNLLCITAVCTVAVPNGEVRRVKEIGVYSITSVTSILAYVWLLIVLRYSSENEVTVGEGVVTLFFFPALVLLAWAQDNSWFMKNTKRLKDSATKKVFGAQHELDNEHREQVGDKIKQVKLMSETGKPGRHAEREADEAAVNAVSKAIVSSAIPKSWSRAHYRSNAIRGFTGKKRVLPSKKMMEKPDLLDVFDNSSGARADAVAEFEFSNPTYSVMEDAGFIEIEVVCKRATSRIPELKESELSVEYETADGTATSGSDFVPCRGKLVFSPEETRKKISISIIDDNEYEDDEVFFVQLKNPAKACVLGKTSVTAVTIIDDDLPGHLSFTVRRRYVKESDGEAVLTVSRTNGCSGKVTAEYATRDGTAKAGMDYIATTGTLIFEHGETTKQIVVPVILDDEAEDTETFAVEIMAPSGGAVLGDIPLATVYISDDDGTGKLVAEAERMAAEEMKKFELGSSSWGKQFKDAMTIVGDINEDGEYDPPATMDYVMHGITFFWKVLFAIVPPTDIAGGWAAFCGALFMIGCMTALVGELAGLLGCVMGLRDPVTAITFVALGTSLPDTFASKQAVEQEEHADAAIGNIVGSNSVNVFLGLGLPWMIASIIKEADGDKYAVPAGSLAFSVTIFTVLAVMCLLILAARRMIVGGELGGGQGKWAVAATLVSFWFIYILVVSLEVYGHIEGF